MFTVREADKKRHSLIELVRARMEGRREMERHMRVQLNDQMITAKRQMIEAERRIAAAEAKANRIAAERLQTIDITNDNGIDPRACYVYLLWEENEVVPLYVGRSKNVFSRIGNHVNRILDIRRVEVIRCENAHHMASLEKELIAFYLPPMNIAGKPSLLCDST